MQVLGEMMQISFFSSEIEFMLKVLCCKHFDNIIKSSAKINKNIRFTSDAVSNLLA